jgi:hypothetical protein
VKVDEGAKIGAPSASFVDEGANIDAEGFSM